MIKMNYETGERKYFDRLGNEITEGCTILFPLSGKLYTVYKTTDGELGTDATNPAWIAAGRAAPCEFGIYPLNLSDTNSCEIVNQ